MWDSEKAFDKVLQMTNRLNEFDWKHTQVFKGLKQHNPLLYNKITIAQNDIDNSFTAKEEHAFNKAIGEFERLIGELYLVYTGKKVRE